MMCNGSFASCLDGGNEGLLSFEEGNSSDTSVLKVCLESKNHRN